MYERDRAGKAQANKKGKIMNSLIIENYEAQVAAVKISNSLLAKIELVQGL